MSDPFDDFRCAKCGAETMVAQDDPAKTVCPDCCAEHVYDPIEGMEIRECRFCGTVEDWIGEWP